MIMRLIGLASIAMVGLGVSGSVLASESGSPSNGKAEKVKTPPSFSKTEVQFLWGNDLQLGSLAPDTSSVVTITVEHFSTWSLGDNFFFLDIANETDGNTNTSLYSEGYPYLSISKITGKKLSFGPILDFGPQIGYNAGNNDLVLLYGAKAYISIPGFEFFNIQTYAYHTVNDPLNRDLNTTFQITTAWSIPIKLSEKIKFTIQGFTDFIGPQGSGVASQFLTQPQLRLDIGRFLKFSDPARVQLGFEYSYWHNKFGVRGVNESAMQAMVVFKLH